MKEHGVKVIKVTGILFLIVLLTVAILLLLGEFGGDPNLSNLYRDGKEINGVFTNYNNRIYAVVPSSGYYLIEEADVASFREVDEHISNRQFAVDKNNAYCGNRIVKGFDPVTSRALGEGYFTDGKMTCYCAPMSVPNHDLSGIAFVLEKILYGAGLVDKPQKDIYPLQYLQEGNTVYSPLLRARAATNGKLVYYQGELLPKADPLSLQQLPMLYNDGDIRYSFVYLADDKHVYYKNDLLPLQANNELHALAFDAQNQENYLVDPKEGMVYVNKIPFDKSYAPYKELSLHGGHIFHSFFLSKSGIFYYDAIQKKVMRIDENPFNESNFTEIEPLIFSDNKRIFYLETSEHWGGRRDPGLKSQSTHIFQLDEPVDPTAWQKVGPVNYKFGAVWKNGNHYFYFDQLGNNQGIRKTIYRITDQTTVNKLLEKDIRTDDIRGLIRDKKMTPVKGKEVLQAKTVHRENSYWFIWIILSLTLGVRAVLWLLRKAGVDPQPFTITNKQLKINSLWPKRYELFDIDEVTFYIERAARQPGYTGRFQVILRSGEHSRKYMFASQMRLKADTKDELELYIADLQHKLTSYKVKSSVFI
ncbi:DKNYY domain-containing protein [Sphingobacterium yanglingense]|uniref:DKNYY family protein n=1 Tax=Sphingobacterium yanglingense TaxID=1437280 RepID=A0A4V3DEB6_9SPHI|nr:DKNYY domain-containing protein [Sphingobacterium yanglingense]TDQ79609.1 DKNYY family protein [Sphingobacterium yanglingense]